jgi:hypothetical protein
MPASKRVNKCSIEEQADSSDCDGGKKLHDHIGRTTHREFWRLNVSFNRCPSPLESITLRHKSDQTSMNM